jgi:hypothetical protein
MHLLFGEKKPVMTAENKSDLNKKQDTKKNNLLLSQHVLYVKSDFPEVPKKNNISKQIKPVCFWTVADINTW